MFILHTVFEVVDMDTKEEIITVDATVKWFNQFKGYGFVSVDGILDDIFLHFSVIEKSHIDHLNNGDVLKCTIQKFDRGYQVVSIDEIVKRVKYETDDSKIMQVIAQTKWFNPLKGFGFAQLSTGEDVFIHSSLLMKSGIKGLEPNIKVKLTIRKTNFGFEALDIKKM